MVDWGKVDKEDYLLAMERSPVKDVEIKVLLKNALKDKIGDREIYMKGIDASYYYDKLFALAIYISCELVCQERMADTIRFLKVLSLFSFCYVE